MVGGPSYLTYFQEVTYNELFSTYVEQILYTEVKLIKLARHPFNLQ